MAQRWDEYDSMFDHSEISWGNTSEGNLSADIKPSDEVINSWNEKIREVTSLVQKGITETDEWCIKSSNWVEFKTGGFTGRSFSVSTIITEERVVKYLSNHKVKITKNETMKLMREISNLNATDSKAVLKKYILKRKGKIISLNSENINPTKEEVKYAPNESIKHTLEKTKKGSGTIIKNNVSVKNSILSRGIRYIFRIINTANKQG